MSKTIIKFRRGTAEEWTNSSPQPNGEILELGEPGYEKDTGKIKIGDGITGWNDLPYLPSNVSIDAPSNNAILTSDGTNTGINAEPALTFDGQRLRIDCNCPSGTAGISVVGDNKPSTVTSAVFANPTVIDTEDGPISTRHTNRLVFVASRGNEESREPLEILDTVFIIRGDGHNANNTLNAFGALDNRTLRIKGDITAVGTHYLGSSLEFNTSSGGSGLYDHSLLFDHNGILSIDGKPIGNLADNFDVDMSGLSDGAILRYYDDPDPLAARWAPYQLNANDVDFSSVPTSDPLIAGRVWLDTAGGNVLKVSTGV